MVELLRGNPRIVVPHEAAVGGGDQVAEVRGSSSHSSTACGASCVRCQPFGGVTRLESVTTTGSARQSAPALDMLFRSHATSLLRLAAFLTGDRGAAEELVQDAFVAYARQPRPPRPGAELAYLRRAVVNLSRGRHRHLIVVRRHPSRPEAPVPAAEDEAARRHVQSRVADAIHLLSDRQRECMVLRCYSEATDTEIADALGISVGSVKSHLHRARVSLATVLEDLR